MGQRSVLYLYCILENDCLLAFWIILTHMCSYMWPESAGMGWVEPVRYSMQTLTIEQHLFGLHSSGSHYPYVHMSLCLCLCFMSGLCRLLGFAAAYLYSVLWNIFQTLWSTTPPSPIRLRLWSFIMKTWKLVEMFRLSLSAIFKSSLCNLLKKCMCVSAILENHEATWTKMSCTSVFVRNVRVLLSCGIPVKLFLACKSGVSQHK